MKPRTSIFWNRVPWLVLGLALWVGVRPVAAQSTDPRTLIDGLRSLAVEARIELQLGSSSATPKLFQQAVPDGRTWMDTIADTLGAAAGGDTAQPGVKDQWALLDEAVGMALAEAEAMKRLAAANAGTPDEAKFQSARRSYLAGAARLLKFYRVAAGDVFDATAGALPEPFGLPDWLLPGQIQLKEIGGAGRLNTHSGEFAGRLSGTMLLPGLGATLVVPNASFDSDGRFDLSAYGAVQLPVGVLSIPPRQPLHYRSTPERGQLLEGSARLTLTNGLRFDASMLLADPNYCFGLAARGLEFDLGKSLLVRVPTLNLNQLNGFGDATRDAFADYFLGLNGAMETLINAATNFPPISETEFGQPPEFQSPPITGDFSALNAWSAEIIARTRAGLSNAQQSLQPVLDSVAKLNADARSATNALADERFRLANLAARLELRRRMREAADLAAQQQAISVTESGRLNEILVEGARQEGSNIVALITPDLLDRLGESAEVVQLLIANAVAFHQLGIDLPAKTLPGDPCVACREPAVNPQQRAEALALCAARRHLARYGLNSATGTITNQALFRSLSEPELYRSGRLLSDIEASLTLQGLDVGAEFTVFIGPILDRQRELLLQELEASPSLSRSFELVTLITENFNDSFNANIILDGNELVSRMEAAMAPRLAGATGPQIDAAKAEANQANASRRRQISEEVGQIIGRYRSIGVVPPGDPYRPDFLTQLDRFFQLVGQPVPPGIASGMDAYVRFKVAELRARPFSIEFLTNRLGEAQGIASGIIGLTDWADTRLTNDFGVLTNLQFAVTNFSFSFTAAAELQRGWWLIDRYHDALRQHGAVYGSNVHAGLRLAEQQSRNAALLASSRVAGAFSNLLANIVSHQDVIVPLPGNVEITRIFGRLCYNRETGFLQGCFGGRVEFPEVNTNLFFEISQACLDSALGYDIAGTMRTPLPFGQAKLQVGIDITGTPSGVANFSGSGTLAVPNPPSADRVFDVGLTYDAPSKRMAFDAQGNNLDLRLSEDFVLFGAGFGFDLKPGSPQGSFRLNGSAGLFAKAKPLPAVVDVTNFHLNIENLTTVFSYTTNAFTVSLSNGTIRLPDFFHNGLCTTNQGQAGTGPAVALVPSNPISVTVGAGLNPAASFAGALDLRNIGLNVPGLTNLALEICSARLAFRSNALPALTNLNATLTIPLPGQPAAVIDLTGVEWGLDGFPTAGSIGLRQELPLLDAGGFSLKVRTNSAFGFATTVNGAGRRTTVFTITGGMRGTFSGDLLTDADSGGAFSFETGGTFRWQTDELPTIALDSVTFAARLKLGGVNGFELLGVDANGIPDTTNPNSMASITLTGLTNLFNLSLQRRFEVNITGALGSPDFIFFGLGNAKFVFDGVATGQNPEPQFTVQSLGFREGTQLKLLGQSLLPFRITSGSIAFLDPAKPLNQLFAPENLRFIFSGVVDISLAAPDSNEPGNIPRLFGAVDNVQVVLPNGFNGPPQFSLNTFVLSLENLTIGDMAGLSGGLAVGNLNQPEDLFFAGTVGGGYNGVGIKAVVATRLDGLLGLCLSVNAGAAGIPLDGGTLGGILLTGAEGGVSFLNSFADPCDFKSYLGLTASGAPGGAGIQAAGGQMIRAASGPRVSQLTVLTWQQLDRFQKLHEQRRKLQASLGEEFANAALQVRVPLAPDAAAPTSETLFTAAGSGAGANVSCPTGDCPPATLNLLCQRHPSVAEAPSLSNYNGAYRDKVIFRFTSLDRDTVDDILAAANINLNGSASVVAANFADGVEAFVTTLIPRAPTGMPANQAQELNQFIDASLDAMRDAVAAAVQLAFDNAAPGRTPLEILYEAAYAGVGCVDVTLQLKGTFSYAPISVALSATGGAVASTTGSAGILGSVNLFGLPVGTGEFFYSLTDTNGNPNPALCGGARLAVGPLGLGQMGLAIGCDECVTGTLQAMLNFVQGLTGDLATQAQPILYTFIEQAVGSRLTGIRSRPMTAYFGPTGSGALLTQAEQIAVMAALLNLPEVAEFLQANPGAVSEFGNDAVAALSSRVISLILGIYNGTNPRLQFCGEVEPKIFGISLTGGNTLVAARLSADKTNLRGDATFSPSFVFGNMPFFLLSGGTINNIVPALDEATMGFSLGLPLVNETTLRLLGTNPVQFAAAQVDNLLANATLTFGYELSPFGFKLADGEGRISLPTLVDHPDNPVRRAAHPGQYDGAGRYLAPTLPDRSAILKAALDSNVLAQATWAGRGQDLAKLFPGGSAEATAVAGRELVRDYFPYGGFLGASKVQLPKPITDAPPLAQLAKLFAPPTNIFEQLAIAQDVFNNYILGSREVGELMVYVPFPRPPTNFWLVSRGPQALIDSIAQSDLPTLAANLNLYPAEQFFMRGDVNAQFLGLPIGEGELTADPAAGIFRLTAGVPADSWMRSFFDASLNFEIKRAEYIATGAPASGPGTNGVASPDARLQAALDQLLASASGSTAQKQAAINNAVARITDTLPKASLELALNNLTIPPQLTNVLTASAAAHFYAYSPRFEPGFAGLGPVADARRNGGVAFQGNFNFANYVVINNAELGVAARAAGLPALSGVFNVPTLGVPGLALRNAHFVFSSDPAIGGSFIGANGSVDPLAIKNPFNANQTMLTIRNLTNDAATISAGFDLRKAASGPPLPGFAISPSRVDMPMLGPSLSVRVHGATTNEPFSFSSTGPWGASVSIVGQLGVRDLLGNEVLRIGAVGQPFTATLTGNALTLNLLDIVLPTNVTLVAFPGTSSAQTFTLTSGGVTNRLMISGDGTFVLDGGIAGSLPLSGTGFGSISAGATIHVDNTQMRVTISGNLNGGALDSLSGNATIGGISGQFIATRNGVALSAVGTISPMQFGVFRVAGATGGSITAVLTNSGLSIPSGAKLRIQAQGYPTGDLFTLNAFSISGNGNFLASAQSGALNLPGFFSTTAGSFVLQRVAGVASLDVVAPVIDLFPGKPYESGFTPPLQHVFIESTGRFYADSGNRQFPLPGGFVASGRLEFGYEPDVRQPAIGLPAGVIDFGTVTYGLNSSRIINVTNTGTAPLSVDIATPQPEVFNVTPATLNLDPSQSAAVSVRFLPPPKVGPTNGVISFFHNGTGGLASLTASGVVRATPVMLLSSPALDLGSAKVNQTVTRAFRVDNLGLTNLLITNRIVTGPFAVTPANVLIPPGGFGLLNVNFTPGSIANFNGSLELRSNAGGGARNVALSGAGAVISWLELSASGDQWRAIATSGSSNAVVVTTNRVYYTDNRGHSWFSTASNLLGGWRAAAMVANSRTGWIAGDNLFKKTADGGQTWQDVAALSSKATSWRAMTEQPGLNRVVLAGRGTPLDSSANIVAIERASGFDIATLPSSLGGTPVGVAWAKVGANTIGLVAGFNAMYRSVDGGSNWVSIANPSGIKAGIAMNGSGVALAVASTTSFSIDFTPPPPISYIHRSIDSGATWSQAFVATGFVFNAVSMDGAVAYAVGKGSGFNGKGVVYRSGDSGATWQLQDVDAPGLFSVSAKLGETFLAGEDGSIQRRPLNPPSHGVLTFDPGRINFGFVPINDSSPRALVFQNIGISNITITNVVISGANAKEFAIGGAFPMNLPPGGSGSINVFFNPTSATNVSASLRINANDPEGVFNAQLDGASSQMGWVLKAPLTTNTALSAVGVRVISDTLAFALASADLYKSVDNGSTWQVVNTPAGTFRTMFWVDANEGYIGGGSLSIPVITTGSSFIYRTTNGGLSWSTVYKDTDFPVRRIDVLSGGTGYAVTMANSRIFGTGGSGSVLKTTNSGLGWFEVTRPETSFGGSALATISTVEAFVSDGDKLYRTADGGTSWSAVVTNGGAFIYDLDFFGSQAGWLAGAGGAVRRTVSGGDTPAEWTLAGSATTSDVTALHFVSTALGWALPSTAAPEVAIFRSDNGGLTWRDELAESPYGGPTNLRPTVVYGRATITNSLALGTAASVRRLEMFTNELEGVSVSLPSLDFGQVIEGTTSSTNFLLRNIGDRALTVSNLLVDGFPGFNEGFLSTTAVPFTVPVNGSRLISVLSSNLVVGTNDAGLSIISDGARQSLNVNLRAIVQPVPVVVSFETVPPGLTLKIDGVSVPGPTTRTIRTGASVTGDWDMGSTHAILAPETQLVNGVTFTFAGWLPFEEAGFDYVATNRAVKYIASYVADGEAAPEGGVALFSAAGGPPAGLPTGPYLRLSNASISNALLGSFAVNGSVLLSADAIEASLAADAFRLPADPANPALIRVSAGAWRFSLSNQAVRLKAQSPSIQILSNSVSPPSLFTLDLNLSNSNFRSTFSLPQGAKVAPGLLEIGTASASLTHTSFFALNLAGQIHALRKPDGVNWAVNINTNVTIAEGPFTNSLPLAGTVLQVPVPGTSENFVVARGTNVGSTARFELRRAGNGAFSLFLTNLAVDVLGQNLGRFAGVASSTGQLTLSAGPPASPFVLGPFRWHPTGSSSLEWNVKNGALKFNVSGGSLKDSGNSVPGWPDTGLLVPGIEFDSNGDFERTITLNSFTFDGITLGQAPDAGDRYVTFKRVNGVLSLKLRDRVEFFDSLMKLKFNINSAGAASGSFKGSFGVDFGGFIGYVEFGSVDISYDSSEPEYQFREKVRVAGNDFRIKYGSGGARVCYLYCDDNGCTEVFCLP